MAATETGHERRSGPCGGTVGKRCFLQFTLQDGLSEKATLILRVAAYHHKPAQAQDSLYPACITWAQCLSELLLCLMRVLWCLGSCGAFHGFLPSFHRASRSVNVKVTMSGMDGTVSLNSCPLTAAYRTTDSATQMPTVWTFTSRVSVTTTLAQSIYLRLVCRREKKDKTK